MKTRNLSPKLGKVLVLVTLFVLTGLVAFAHKPLPGEGEYSDPQHPLEVKDIEVSQVVYYQLSEDTPRLWLTFSGKAGHELYLSLGIPKIDRLENFRPAMAVLGPGFSEILLPFEIPENMGGRVFETQDVRSPSVFYEPFTGTSSWELKEATLNLPVDGQYYVVAYPPQEEYGKLWVAMGRKEAFGLVDILNLPKTISKARSFHEVPGSPMWLNIMALLLFGAIVFVMVVII